MGFPLVGVDAFTRQPFHGNPAAVCVLDQPADERWMQSLAAEMNLSETAFLVPQHVVRSGVGETQGFGLRWFTPITEVELCGHATLASAHALWDLGRLANDQPAIFETRWKGTLTATRRGDAIALDFPAARSEACEPPAGLLDALGVRAVATSVNALHHVVELEDADAVRGAAPDFARLLAVDVEGVTITARADDADHDFVSRYFTPRYGIDEDPVTGAAHTSLGPYWAERLGTTDLRAMQLSRRVGELAVEVRDDRVNLIGHAVTVWRGEVAG
jgi:PhzF family phenazine biosynthesis protein